jgi:hypothetical protein
VDFTANGTTVGLQPRDWIQAAGPALKTGALGDVNVCCRGQSNGGAGGGGVVQIHVPNPDLPPSNVAAATDIVVPTAALASPNVLDRVSSPPPYVLIPSFGARSKARSKWISIGGADQKPNGSEGLVRFLFEGIDPVTGKVLTNGSTVADVQPLLTVPNIATSAVARILPDGFTVEVTGNALLGIRASKTSGVSNDVYLRTPALFEDCAIRLVVVPRPTTFEDFDIASAVYLEGGPSAGDEKLRLTITTERGKLTDFNQGSTEPVGLRLMPRFFQVTTNGLENALPTTAFVRVSFQAAEDNGVGAPDEQNPLVDWTSDIREFNTQPAGALQFFRYEVEFDLDSTGIGVTSNTDPVALDFLKIPFVF